MVVLLQVHMMALTLLHEDNNSGFFHHRSFFFSIRQDFEEQKLLPEPQTLPEKRGRTFATPLHRWGWTCSILHFHLTATSQRTAANWLTRGKRSTRRKAGKREWTTWPAGRHAELRCGKLKNLQVLRGRRTNAFAVVPLPHTSSA